jgi:hypothetical protein
MRPYSRLSRPKPLLFLPSIFSIVLMRLIGPRSRSITKKKKSGSTGNRTRTSGSAARNSDLQRLINYLNNYSDSFAQEFPYREHNIPALNQLQRCLQLEHISFRKISFNIIFPLIYPSWSLSLFAAVKESNHCSNNACYNRHIYTSKSIFCLCFLQQPILHNLIRVYHLL